MKNSPKYNHLQSETEKKYAIKDQRKRKRMHQSGKSVLAVARIIQNKQRKIRQP